MLGAGPSPRLASRGPSELAPGEVKMGVGLAIAMSLHLLSTALLVGFMAMVEWTLVPAQSRLDAQGYTILEQGMNRVLMRLSPILMVTALLSGLATTVLSVLNHLGTWPLFGVAAVCTMIMIISTIAINAPVNSAIEEWDPENPPSYWRTQRDRWAVGHRLRSYVGLIALLSLVIAVVLPVVGSVS